MSWSPEALCEPMLRYLLFKSKSTVLVLDMLACCSRAPAAKRCHHPSYLLVSVHPVACILSACFNSTLHIYPSLSKKPFKHVSSGNTCYGSTKFFLDTYKASTACATTCLQTFLEPMLSRLDSGQPCGKLNLFCFPPYKTGTATTKLHQPHRSTSSSVANEIDDEQLQFRCRLDAGCMRS